MNRGVLTRGDRNQLFESLLADSDEFTIIISQLKTSREVAKYLYTANNIEDLSKLEFVEHYPQVVNFIRQMAVDGRTSGFITLDNIEVIVDIIRRQRTLMVMGAGHVGRSVALIGAMVGFAIVLIDDREGFLTRDKITDERVKCLASEFRDALGKCIVDSNSSIIIVTRGHQHDMICLREALRTNARYIGMIGSKRRVLSILKELEQSELSVEECKRLSQVYAPIGLEIGARLPEEIAISILAQVIQVINCKN
jgi:xanthine/CO dehydrogenase XdhC/CoxF family maturation factor